MNKKTFSLAALFLCATLVWFGVNIFWAMSGRSSVFDLIIAGLFVLAAVGMLYNESKKKKRKHLDEVNKFKIP